MRGRRQPERLPHVHHGKAKARTLARAEPAIELTHACFRAVLAAEPDRPAAIKVAHHDPIGVALADGISSMPIARGAGVPARLSCASMYCISSALTVCQSSPNSVATSLIVASRQRRPT